MKLITALILSVTAITAQADPLGDSLKQIGFNQTNKGINKTVFAVYEKPMDLSSCQRFTTILATNLRVAPTNLVETTIFRLVRWPTDFGSMLLSCSGPDAKAVIALSRNNG
jgi:hypothetical protein